MKHFLLIPGYLGISLFLIGCHKGDTPVQKPEQDNNEKKTESPQLTTKTALANLRSSPNPDDLVKAAEHICQANDEDALNVLVEQLATPMFTDRLDPRKDWRDLRRNFSKIMGAISKMPPDKYQKTLIQLGTNKGFMDNDWNVVIFLLSCGEIHEPTPELLKLLDGIAGPKQVGGSDVISALARMRSPKASKIVEKWFYSPEYHIGTKGHWFVGNLLEIRDDPAQLQLYKAIFSRGIDHEELRNLVVLSFVDFRPIWFGDGPKNTWPQPPPRREATDATLKEILAIADIALKLDLTEDTRKTVLREKADIGKTLEFRRDGHPARIEKLILDLASDKFKDRDYAARELEKYGDRAEPFLRRALEKEKRLEPRLRLERLVEKLKKLD